MRLRIEIHAVIPDEYPLSERAERNIASALSSVAGSMLEGPVKIKTDRIEESEQESIDFMSRPMP